MNALYIIPLLSFFGPLPIMVLEWIIPFPSVIEEFFSVLIVVFILKEEKKIKRKLINLVILSGILFSISESFLYLTNILALGNMKLFFVRLIFTTLIHTSNIIFIYLLGKRGVYWLIVSVVIAILMHYLYNNFFVYLIVEKVGF